MIKQRSQHWWFILLSGGIPLYTATSVCKMQWPMTFQWYDITSSVCLQRPSTWAFFPHSLAQQKWRKANQPKQQKTVWRQKNPFCLLSLSYANLTALFHESFNWHNINWKVCFSSQSSCSFYCSAELIFWNQRCQLNMLLSIAENWKDQEIFKAGACTTMVDEQTQCYRISFKLTKPNHSNPALLVPWCWSWTFFVNSGFDPEFVEHVHMNVWHHWRTANHEPWLKVKDFAKG